jgi:hypothetical protein
MLSLNFFRTTAKYLARPQLSNQKNFSTSLKSAEISLPSPNFNASNSSKPLIEVSFPHLLKAAEGDNVTLLRTLINNYPKFNEEEKCKFSGETIIHIAAKYGNFAAIEELDLAINAPVLNSLNKQHETPLASAAHAIKNCDSFAHDDYVRIIEHFLERGALTSFHSPEQGAKTIHIANILLLSGEVGLFQKLTLNGAKWDKDMELNRHCLKFEYLHEALQLSNFFNDIKEFGLIRAIHNLPSPIVKSISHTIENHNEYAANYLAKFGKIYNVTSERVTYEKTDNSYYLPEEKCDLAHKIIDILDPISLMQKQEVLNERIENYIGALQNELYADTGQFEIYPGKHLDYFGG